MTTLKTSQVRSVANVMAAVKVLLPEIRERAAQVETDRRVPRDLVEKLRAAGCFRMAVPRELGGLECRPAKLFELYELLAAADAAVAWIVMIGGPTPSYLSMFSETIVRRAYSTGPDLIMAAALAPTGVATPVPGGYRVNGRWQWGSGSTHADLFACTCRIEGAEPDATTGFPAMRAVLLGPDEVELRDTWRVSGLRGSGSGDIVVADRFVPEEHTGDLFGEPGPLLRQAQALGAPAGLYVAAVALGIARGALEDLITLVAQDKRRLGAARRLADDGVFQTRLGQAETQLRAAHAALHAQAEAWEAVAMGLPLGVRPAAHPELTAAAATAVWVTQTSAAVVDAAYNAAGGSSIWESSNLQRRFRDIHAATQHISVAEGVLARRGAALAGVRAA